MVGPLDPLRLRELDPIEAAASRSRAAAGIRPEAPVADVVAVLRQFGLVVAVRELGEEGLDGIYASAKPVGVIVLNSSKFTHRVRLVACHLLAHHVYGDEPHLDHDIDAPSSDLVQRRANAFAARFLISREALRARTSGSDRMTTARILQLAAELGVGYQVLAERLHDLRAQPAAAPSQLSNAVHPPHSAR